MSMLLLEREVEKLNNAASLSKAAEDVEKVIETLTKARQDIVAANNTTTTSLALTRLQNPIKNNLETLNSDIKKVYKAQSEFQKTLKTAFPKASAELLTDHDPMGPHKDLIDRAIAMHFLREGQFGVASTFINECQSQDDPQDDPQDELEDRDPLDLGTILTTENVAKDTNAPVGVMKAFQSGALRSSFAEMYGILSSMKEYDLDPAIAWARSNRVDLEARGSNLEFELCKLQFIWLFRGCRVTGRPQGTRECVDKARRYGNENFSRFQHRHMHEIRKLAGAMVFAPNLSSSPYGAMFDISLAFDEVSSTFTREFCSLLGLSPESPLYVAVTAGSLALPRLVKYTSMTKAKGTEWTSTNELAFETPLPESMFYHPIFVCPVSKEQTTETNPPVILSCGHLFARESLQRSSKTSHRIKCPYCPAETYAKAIVEVILGR